MPFDVRSETLRENVESYRCRDLLGLSVPNYRCVVLICVLAGGVMLASCARREVAAENQR